MFGYYLELAIWSFRRSKALLALVVLVIGLGIGASMTMVTVLHVMSSDPLPGRSSTLFFPHLEPGPKGLLSPQVDPGNGLTWLDARNLLRASRAARQSMMASGRLVVDAPSKNLKPFYSQGSFVSTEFFAMFGAPFAAGTGWDAQADQNREQVVVLNGGLALKLYGSAAAAIGRTIDLEGHVFRVSGVLRDWHPEPAFYRGASGTSAFESEDAFFLPLTTAMALNFPVTTDFEVCWGGGGLSGDNCSWVQFWIELDTREQVADYGRFLEGYWHAQRNNGRFAQNEPPKLDALLQRLEALDLIPSDVRLQFWLAIGFLGVCLFNAIGLMLAKFLCRGGEISVRRAMGATKRDIFLQLGVEAAVIGLAGGCIGLLIAQVGLWLVRQNPDAYAKLAHLDPGLMLGTFGLAVVATVLAGLLPAWSACRIAPALLLKVQ